MIPGFPNLWTLYGPNTNGGLQVPTLHEMTTLYALRCIEGLLLDDKASVDVTPDAYWRYNQIIDERNDRKAWGRLAGEQLLVAQTSSDGPRTETRSRR